MIKNIFEVNNEEKSRILNLHESATKRQYMSEQGNVTTMTTEPQQSFEPKNYDVGMFAKNCYIVSYNKNENHELFSANTKNNINNIVKTLDSFRKKHVEDYTNPDNSDNFFINIGKQVKSNTELFNKLKEYAHKNGISTVGID